MNLTRDRVRSMGWAAVLSICVALLLALTFRVNAVKSEVRLTERQIVTAKREKMFLESEFLARASQQQLRQLNEVEFGYEAPGADQYIEGERQLVAFSNQRAIPGSPTPLRVATADVPDEGRSVMAMVSPLSGKAVAATLPAGEPHRVADAGTLAERLARVDRKGPAAE